ncbi:MAG: geranylgeranyl reductase family protein [Nitrospirota bacterium]|nr:geranylgeranyl reductase family protein [Nitrospirota bacterium]
MSISLSSRKYDVIVVGMGPAGASAAYELSKRGISVLAFDKQVHPRYKVCGGGLSARIGRILPSDFPSVVEEAVHRVQFTYGDQESFLIESLEPIAYMVMRQHFDQWLVEKAREVGTEIREGETVVDIQDGEEGVDVFTKQGRYRSRVVIGADGVMSVVAQQCFPGRSLRSIPALESEVQGGPLHAFQETPTALISLQAAKKGYGWIFPKQQGISVGVGEFVKGTKRPKQSFRDFIGHEPTLAGLKIPAPLGHLLPIAHASRNGHSWLGRLVHGRAMLVGDAGHLVDPLLGEGIYYAVRSGQLAAKSVSDMLCNPVQHQLSDYETFVGTELGPEFRVAGRLGKIIYGLPRSIHRWAGQRFPDAYQRVLHRYCELLQGKETYQSLWNRILQRLNWPFAQRSGA